MSRLARSIALLGAALIPAASALVLVGLVQASPPKRASTLTVRLAPRDVTPQPEHVRPGATATFTGTLSRYDDDEFTLRFRLSVARLTGDPTACHIHLGARAATGRVIAFVCGPRIRLRGVARGSRWLPWGVVDFMRREGAYVDVHTERNPRGELRGQIPRAALAKEIP